MGKRGNGETRKRRNDDKFFLPLSLPLLAWMLAVLSGTRVLAQDAAEIKRGVQFFADGRFVEAREVFSSLVKEHPENPVGVFYLGRLAFEEQRFDQAIEWFEKAVQQMSENSDYHLWLGRAYGYQALRSNIFIQPFLARKVKVHFEQAVALNPDNLAARADLQEYYEKAPGFLGGSTEKARQQAEEIAKRQQPQVQR
jgi:tetratricopeptide (TPR) repeat protein